MTKLCQHYIMEVWKEVQHYIVIDQETLDLLYRTEAKCDAYGVLKDLDIWADNCPRDADIIREIQYLILDNIIEE